MARTYGTTAASAISGLDWSNCSNSAGGTCKLLEIRWHCERVNSHCPWSNQEPFFLFLTKKAINQVKTLMASIKLCLFLTPCLYLDQVNNINKQKQNKTWDQILQTKLNDKIFLSLKNLRSKQIKQLFDPYMAHNNKKK